MEAGISILVVRADRIGDVVLSTPVFEAIRSHYPRARISVMVREAVAPLLRGLSSIDEVLVYEPEGRHAGVSGFFELLRDFRQRRFKLAVCLQSQARIAAALFGVGVPYRVGPLSKLHSFLFYNRGIRQSRSQVEMHEADYNLQLLRRLGIRSGARNLPTRVHLDSGAVDRAEAFLKPLRESASRIVAVHPGMGGSALNWPEESYRELIESLLAEGISVVVTGGGLEKDLLERFQERLPAHPGLRFWGGANSGPVSELAGLFSRVDLVIAPSTGPLHVAVALAKPVVTFYPPVRVQSAIRWGPYVADERKASVLVPENYCGEEFRCRGSLCHHYPCMKSIPVRTALQQVREQLRLLGPSP
jgi:heptosyltransferase-3